ASSETSQRMASVLWPLSAISLATDCTSFSFQSANTTDAPDSANALAVARPKPDAAPVTSATLFSKDMFITCSSHFDRVVSRFLVELVPLGFDIRAVHLLLPLLRFDFLKPNRN